MIHNNYKALHACTTTVLWMRNSLFGCLYIRAILLALRDTLINAQKSGRMVYGWPGDNSTLVYGNPATVAHSACKIIHLVNVIFPCWCLARGITFQGKKGLFLYNVYLEMQHWMYGLFKSSCSECIPRKRNVQKLPTVGFFSRIVWLCGWDNGNNFMLISGNKMYIFASSFSPGTREISWHQHSDICPKELSVGGFSSRVHLWKIEIFLWGCFCNCSIIFFF